MLGKDSLKDVEDLMAFDVVHNAYHHHGQCLPNGSHSVSYAILVASQGLSLPAVPGITKGRQ